MTGYAIRMLFLVVLLSFCFFSNAIAYNFHSVSDGVPDTWDDDQTIKYYLDPGPYGDLTNEQAHALLKEAMKIWEEAPNAKVPHFEFAGFLPEDVDGTNYEKYISNRPCLASKIEECGTESQRMLQTIIIFDSDRDILPNLCRNCAGRAHPTVYEYDEFHHASFVQGDVVLGGVGQPINIIMTVVVHELGHLLGLGHVVMGRQFCDTSGIPNIEYSYIFSTMQVTSALAGDDGDGVTLNPDDIAGISILYPSDTFSAETATIKGRILKSDGTPMEHVNVVARNIEDPWCEAYSFMSGELNYYSEYVFMGLKPGDYTVEVEDVSGDRDLYYLDIISYPQLTGPAEFWNEDDVADEDSMKRDIITVAGGEVRENVDIVLAGSVPDDSYAKMIPAEMFEMGDGRACAKPATDYAALIGYEDPDDGNSSAPSGGCSLIVGD